MDHTTSLQEKAAGSPSFRVQMAQRRRELELRRLSVDAFEKNIQTALRSRSASPNPQQAGSRSVSPNRSPRGNVSPSRQAPGSTWRAMELQGERSTPRAGWHKALASSRSASPSGATLMHHGGPSLLASSSPATARAATMMRAMHPSDGSVASPPSARTQQQHLATRTGTPTSGRRGFSSRTPRASGSPSCVPPQLVVSPPPFIVGIPATGQTASRYGATPRVSARDRSRSPNSVRQPTPISDEAYKRLTSCGQHKAIFRALERKKTILSNAAVLTVRSPPPTSQQQRLTN